MRMGAIAVQDCDSANHMDRDDLRCIHALGTAGTLAGAAEVLGMHHSMVFRRMGRIEAGLGVRLFDRYRDGTSLTPTGEQDGGRERFVTLLLSPRQAPGIGCRLPGPRPLSCRASLRLIPGNR